MNMVVALLISFQAFPVRNGFAQNQCRSLNQGSPNYDLLARSNLLKSLIRLTELFMENAKIFRKIFLNGIKHVQVILFFF